MRAMLDRPCAQVNRIRITSLFPRSNLDAIKWLYLPIVENLPSIRRKTSETGFLELGRLGTVSRFLGPNCRHKLVF